MAENKIADSSPEKETRKFTKNLVMVYNPKSPKGADIRDIYAHKVWKHSTNTIKAYSNDFAKYLIGKYQFLEVVKPDDIDKIEERMKSEDFVCPHLGCNFVTTSQEKLDKHLKSAHKIDEKTQNFIDSIEIVEENSGEKFFSYQDKIRASKGLSPEEQEGIPNTSRGNVVDRDGVEWTGGGLERDGGNASMIANRRGGGMVGLYK